MPSSNSALNIANGHVNALIDFVLDYKPYHTKLSQIIEEFIFEDTMTVAMTDSVGLTAFLGADILNPAQYTGSGRKSAISWLQNLISDGNRTIFATPLVSTPKLSSHVNQEKFICGVDDDLQIPGITGGVFSPKRFDGPGITRISNNGNQLHESIDFSISHGAFSFNTYSNSEWKENDVESITDFPKQSGSLQYKNLFAENGTIKDIVGNISSPDYQEWVLECIFYDGVNAQLSVVGSISGNIGTADFDVPFSHPELSFLFTNAQDDAPGELPTIAVGDQFILTPIKKITIHPTAPEEIWTIVKVNPECLTSLSFTPGASSRTSLPDIQVFTRDLHKTPKSTWTITFTDPTHYDINAKDEFNVDIPGYPKIGLELIDGCAYKDSLMHFSFIPVSGGFVTGDEFEFTISEEKPVYRLFGSVSGWDPLEAEIGKWYWNGKIGFKVPHFDYFPIAYSATIAVSEDGENWTTIINDDTILYDVHYVNTGPKIGFLVSGNQSAVASSLEGFTWQNDIVALASDGQRSIVVGESGLVATSTVITESPLTYTWASRNSRTDNDLNDITYAEGFFLTLPPIGANGLFIAVGDHGTIISSATGDSWLLQSSGTTEHLHGIAWKADSPTSVIFVIVGDNGAILNSTDGLNWTLATSGTTEHLNKVLYVEELGKFFTIGKLGTILSSTDGISWVSEASGSVKELFDIAFKSASGSLLQGKLVVVGEDGTLLTSLDGGATWATGISSPFNAITFGSSPNIFVAVGGGPIEATQITFDADVHPMSEASVYTITFQDPTHATVVNNVYGYRRGLKPNEPWTDGLSSFTISDYPSAFNRGDVVKVYIAHTSSTKVSGDYGDLPYDTTPYDSGFALINKPYGYFQNYFPFTHSDGSVIINNCVTNDNLVIDKAVFDWLQLRIDTATNITHPLLATTNDGWVPLEYRLYNRVDGNNDPISDANFSDLATRIDAYLASDPDYRVFSLEQPRYKCTDRSSKCTLTFNEDFVQDYLPLGTHFTLRSMPQDSYGQTIKVRITEKLRIFASINMNFNEFVVINFTDILNGMAETTAEFNYDEFVNVEFVEGGIVPGYFGYGTFPYDTGYYDQTYFSVPMMGIVEGPPGTFTYTGDPLDIYYPGTNVANTAGIMVQEDSGNESAGASFNDGLSIVETIGVSGIRIHKTYKVSDYTTPIAPPAIMDGLRFDVDADEYIVTHDFSPGTPTLIVQEEGNPGAIQSPTPNTNVYDQVPTASSTKSFKFSVAPGTAPFRLRLV